MPVGQGLSISPGVYVTTPILFFATMLVLRYCVHRYYLNDNERGEDGGDQTRGEGRQTKTNRGAGSTLTFK